MSSALRPQRERGLSSSALYCCKAPRGALRVFFASFATYSPGSGRLLRPPVPSLKSFQVNKAMNRMCYCLPSILTMSGAGSKLPAAPSWVSRLASRKNQQVARQYHSSSNCLSCHLLQLLSTLSDPHLVGRICNAIRRGPLFGRAQAKP